jgi:3-hydroxyacyl-CoA dehydrogenase
MKSPVPAMAKIFTQGEYGRITQKGFYDYNQLDTGGE